MSARFYKIFAGVFLVHLLVLNIVWVGFSAPLPRPPVTFMYEGTLPAEDTVSGAEDAWQKFKMSGQSVFDHSDAAYFKRWIMLRNPSKPLAYDHLGF